MTPAETVNLTRYVRALCPQQKFDEFTADAWHDVLGNLESADCRTAVANLSAKQTFISPAEIVTEVRRIRNARLEGFMYVPTDGDDDIRVYLQQLREQKQAVARGLRPANPDAVTTGRDRQTIRELVSGIGRTIPAGDDQ